VHNKAPAIVAMRVHDPDRSRFRIESSDPTSAPTGFMGIVGNDFQVFFKQRKALLAQRWQGRMSVMKSKHSVARNLLLGFCLVCAVCIGTVAQGGESYYRSNRHYALGHLVIDRVPNFGWNLAFNLDIDGRPVANVAQGHSYSTWLPAGPHLLTVHKVPAVGYTEPTSTTVDIQAGAEHLYVAMWDSGRVYLHPAGFLLTPGAFWQLHGDGTP
jgi:hypothetical protein